PVTVEKTATGLRVVIRRPAPAKSSARTAAPPAPPAPKQHATQVAPAAPALASIAPTTAAAAAAAASAATHVAPAHVLDPGDRVRASERLAQLLAAPVAMAHDRGASDVVLSSGQAPRMRVDG